jgi:hypothetical protein
MAGLKNTAKRLANLGKGRGYKTGAERQAEREGKEQAAKDKIFSGAIMPDEGLIKRNERRKAAARRGSRINTVLTDRETLG